MRKAKTGKEGQTMKEQKWDDFENAKEFLEAALMPEEAEASEQKASSTKDKSRVTEMRRRIEERLDSKRIALEYDYLEMEDISDDLDFDDPLERLQ